MYTKKITVFTPTYNRAYIIKKVYDSLRRQTYKDFEWLVIDDGSVDNTKNLIDQFIQDDEIEIVYIKKNNGGKHTAWNKAIERARGQMIISVDSDDYLVDNALERIVFWENTIAEKDKFAGVSGLKIFPSGIVIGDVWKVKGNFIDRTNLERRKAGLMGDKAEAYFTDVLKKFYPFPVFEGENFVPEGVLWNRIAYAGYKIRWFNEGIYVAEYLEDGLTKNGKVNEVKNFGGYTCWKKELIRMQDTYLGVIRESADLVHIALLKGYRLCDTAKIIDRSLLTIWLAKVYYRLREIKNNIKKKINLS